MRIPCRAAVIPETNEMYGCCCDSAQVVTEDKRELCRTSFPTSLGSGSGPAAPVLSSNGWYKVQLTHQWKHNTRGMRDLRDSAGVTPISFLPCRQALPRDRNRPLVLPMEYRSKGHGDKWHFCQNCPDWPAESEGVDVVTFEKLPPQLQACEKCVALRAAGKCSATR